jgi:hypothetical protein
MKTTNRTKFTPISAGEHTVISAWLDCPTKLLTDKEVQTKTNFPAYMVIYKMITDDLLEKTTTFRDGKARFGYCPTKKGWLEYFDYRYFYGIKD